MNTREDDQRRAGPSPFVAAARDKAHTLYAGVVTPHRSCGIALAETFGRATAAYQSLRRGGITGQGECGAIVAGRLVLGELLGDPDPTGPVTPALREAMEAYEARWRERVDRGAAVGDGIVCNTLTGPFPIFRSPERHAFCTALATEVATAVAEVLEASGRTVPITPAAGVVSPSAAVAGGVVSPSAAVAGGVVSPSAAVAAGVVSPSAAVAGGVVSPSAAVAGEAKP